MTPASASHRPDIDGLRAVAILAVLLFHAGFKDWTGGFVGVDVFFVISGYLIIGQVCALADTGRFSFPEFYFRRARRLVPAMAPVLLFALLVAFAAFGANRFGEFLGRLFGAWFFVSNYVFLFQQNYFASEANYNLLLHTWSLSVEWQFYLIIPFLLILAGRRWRLPVLIALTVLSFAWSVWLMRSGGQAQAFYSVLPRLWELGVGGILALSGASLSGRPVLSLAARSAGLALIVFTALTYDEHTAFPGMSAVLPVLGSALIVIPGSADPASRLLASPPMQWLGRISYSVYLWHWPMLVAVRLFVPQGGDLVNGLVLVFSIIIAAFVYQYFEDPVRRRKLFAGNRQFAAAAVAPLALLGGISWMMTSGPAQTAKQDYLFGANMKYIELLERKEAEYKAHKPDAWQMCSFDTLNSAVAAIDCLKDKTKPGTVLVIGDSHARDFVTAAAIAYPQTRFALLHQSSCSPASYDIEKPCFPGLGQVLEGAVREAGVVKFILTSRWGRQEWKKAENTLGDLRRLNAGVLIVGPTPTYKERAHHFVRLLPWQGKTLDSRTRIPPDWVLHKPKNVEAGLAGLGTGFLPVFDWFCDDDGCPFFLRQDVPMIWDDEHLSLEAIEWYADKLHESSLMRSFLEPGLPGESG